MKTEHGRFHRLTFRESGLAAALLGGAAWIFAVGVLRLGLAEALFLLGPLVAVPLGLPLAAAGNAIASVPAAWRLAFRLQMPAALLLAGSFALAPGGPAALMSLPWLFFALWMALLGILRFLGRGPRPLGELAIDCALIFPTIGALATLFSRWGRPYFGFVEPMVLYTAAHFHFAGFVLPLLTGLAARAAPGVHAGLSAAGVIAGVPSVAVGITLTLWGVRWVDLAGAWWMSTACLLAAALQLRLFARTRRIGGHCGPAWLALVSGLALPAGMALAVVFALGNFIGHLWLDFPTMVLYHATTNVFGYALAGLAFWTHAALTGTAAAAWLRPAVDAGHWPGPRIAFRWLGDRAGIEEWERRDFTPGTGDGPRDGDSRDAHEFDCAIERPGEPEPAGPHRRAAESILRYEVFPLRLLTPLISRAPLQVGDAVAASYHFAPGIDLLIGARVIAVFDGIERGSEGGIWRTGFTYRTLAGHPLAGEETFSVEKCLTTGRVRVALRSWSRPASFLARALRPIARRLQLSGGRAGVRRLAETARGVV